MKHLSSWQKRKGCHDNDNGKGATATFQFRQLIETSVQNKMWRERVKDGGVIPVTGFPRVDNGDKAKEGQRAPTIRAWSKHEHLIHHTCIRSRAVVSGLYLRSVRYQNRSSSLREVDVLATAVVEVVVHAAVVELDDTVTRVFGNGSGTHFVVVHIPTSILEGHRRCGTWRIRETVLDDPGMCLDGLDDSK